MITAIDFENSIVVTAINDRFRVLNLGSLSTVFEGGTQDIEPVIQTILLGKPTSSAGQNRKKGKTAPNLYTVNMQGSIRA